MLYSQLSIALGSWPEDCNVFACGVPPPGRFAHWRPALLLVMLKTGTFTGDAEDRHFYWWCWRPSLLLVMLKTGTFTGDAEHQVWAKVAAQRDHEHYSNMYTLLSRPGFVPIGNSVAFTKKTQLRQSGTIDRSDTFLTNQGWNTRLSARDLLFLIPHSGVPRAHE